MENNVSLSSGSGINAYYNSPLTITGPGKLKVTNAGIASTEPLTFVDADVEVAQKVFGQKKSLMKNQEKMKKKKIMKMMNLMMIYLQIVVKLMKMEMKNLNLRKIVNQMIRIIQYHVIAQTIIIIHAIIQPFYQIAQINAHIAFGP